MGAKGAYIVRLLMVGDSACGKTSLVLRFDQNVFSTKFVTTIGVDYRDKMVKVSRICGPRRGRCFQCNVYICLYIYIYMCVCVWVLCPVDDPKGACEPVHESLTQASLSLSLFRVFLAMLPDQRSLD